MMAATLLIFAAVVIAHLAAISKGMDALKSGTKIFLIPLMFVAFNSVAAAGGIHVDNIGLLMAVLLFYTLGDKDCIYCKRLISRTHSQLRISVP